MTYYGFTYYPIQKVSMRSFDNISGVSNMAQFKYTVAFEINSNISILSKTTAT